MKHLIHCGEIVIAPETNSDSGIHRGDEDIYVNKEVLNVLVLKKEAKKGFDLQQSYELDTSQTMLISERYKHR